MTLTTVGYGDIVPKTSAGRFAGVAIMFTGVAVLGVLAGSLAQLFNIGADEKTDEPAADPAPVSEELAAVRTQLRALEAQLGALVERTRAG